MCNLMYSLEIVLSIFNQKNLADINVRRYIMLNLENMHCSTSQPNWNQAKKMYYYSSSPVEECLCRPWRSVSEVINSWVFLYTGVKAGQNYELSKTQDFLETKEKKKQNKTNKQTNHLWIIEESWQNTQISWLKITQQRWAFLTLCVLGHGFIR